MKLSLKSIAILFFSLISISIGIADLWDVMEHSEIVSLPFTDSAARSLPRHVRLTDLAFEPMETVSGKEVGQPLAYIPIRPRNADPKANFSVVVLSHDPALVEGASGDAMLKAVVMLSQKTEVTGAVDPHVTQSELRRIHEANPRIARQAIVINEGEKPSSGIGWFAIVLGTLGLLRVIFESLKPAGPVEPPLLNPNEPPLLEPPLLNRNEPPILAPNPTGRTPKN